MSEFKGTKGKWHIDENYEIKHNVFSICLINRFTPTTDIFKANALLISKAPEILEMLRKLYANDLLKDNQNEVLELIKEATEI